MEDIIIATFQDPSVVPEGMAELRRLHETGALRVLAAAVIERRADGTWHFDKEAAHPTYKGAVAGGVVGGLLGALMGPVAALLGGTMGLVAGELLDVVEDDTRELILEVMIRHVPPGTTAIVADIEEEADDSLDLAITKLGGQAKRWPRAEVIAELEGADEAEEAGRREIRRILHRSKTKEPQSG